MFDIAIIGAGPAGASAAIFTARADVKTLMIDDDTGLTRRALLRNHYGVKEMNGPDVVKLGIEQATDFGTEYVKDKVVSVEKTDNGFKVSTETESYQAKQVMLATGNAVKLAEDLGVEILDATEPRTKYKLKVNQDGKTDVEGVWAAGTVAGMSGHTIITAGDGARVAINLISELKGERYVDHDFLHRPEKNKVKK